MSSADPDRGPEPVSVANAATVDVEDWHPQLYRALTGHELPPTEHLVTGTRILIDLLRQHNVAGTFFVTGLYAATFPGLVRDIAAAGHEVACHGWAHRPTQTLTPGSFREDLRRSQGALQDLLSTSIEGYRAPYFSIGPAEMWALDIIAQAGFRYDSSLSPLRFAAAGRALAPGLQYVPVGGGASLVEFPMTTVRWLGKERNIGGGRLFRLLPRSAIVDGFRRLNELGIAAQTYTHSYEVLPYALTVPRPLPRVLTRAKAHRSELAASLPWPLTGLPVWATVHLVELAYTLGRQRTAPRLAALLKDRPRWVPIRQLVADFVASRRP